MLCNTPPLLPEDVAANEPAFSGLLVEVPAYHFALPIETMSALTTALWPQAEVVEFDAIQPDGSSPVYVDGIYAGDAVQLVGVLYGCCGLHEVLA